MLSYTHYWFQEEEEENKNKEYKHNGRIQFKER